MPWYRTGTVAITAGSTTVTGTGTQFAQNSRVGDAFQGPDGNWYEVTNIASATVLSILPAYKGTTVTGGAYGLAPMQGYVKQSADQLRTITNQYGTTLGLIGSPADIAGLRANIGAAKSGVNSDITQLTGITQPLGTTMGGTGSNTPAGARSALGLGEAARLNYSAPPAITATGTIFDDQTAVRVADSVFTSHARSGYYGTSTSGVNIDTVPNGWCGLITSTGSNNTGTFPPFASSGFFWLSTQATYVNNAATQIAYRYGANSTSGTNLNPTMAIRTRNAPGTAWGPWGVVQTDQDLTTSTLDSTIGKILRVGDFGIGVSNTTAPLLANLDGSVTPSGTYVLSGTSSSTGTFPAGVNSYGTLVVVRSSGSNTIQTYYPSGQSNPYPLTRSWSSTGGWTPWVAMYNKNNIVGTVSTTNPSGAIIERGNNANGEYTKFADGTMIAWARRTDTGLAISTNLGGMGFRSAAANWVYPVPFVGSPAVMVNPRVATAFSAYAVPSSGSTGTDYYYLSPTSVSTTTDRSVDIIAIGRWPMVG